MISEQQAVDPAAGPSSRASDVCLLDDGTSRLFYILFVCAISINGGATGRIHRKGNKRE